MLRPFVTADEVPTAVGRHRCHRPRPSPSASAAGIADGDEPTIFYCGSGVLACVKLLAAEHAGTGRGRLYVGS